MEFEGDVLEFSFEDTLFKTVNHTYVLTCSSSRNRDRIVKMIKKIRPTRRVTLFVSKPWRQKTDKRIVNSVYDIGVNHACMYEHAKNIDDYILVLEDDATFWWLCDRERREIERFLRDETPGVYLLGHLATCSARRDVHFKVECACATHAQFLDRKTRAAWICGISKFLEEDSMIAIDDSTSPCSPNNGRVRNVYMYCRPIVTQVFVMSENRLLWNDNLSRIQKYAVSVLMLDRFHFGWIVVYLYMAVGYLFYLDPMWM